MIQIPLKKKYIASKSLYGYPRTHSGNGRKRSKRVGNSGYSDPYNKRSHVLVLLPNMKLRWVHGELAHKLLG